MQGGYGYPPPPQQQPMWQQQPAPMRPMPMQQPMPVPPKKGGSGALIAVILLFVLLLVGGGLAGIAYYVLSKPAPHLARYVPKTATVYFELPSFKRSIMSAAAMKPLDSSRVDDKLMMQDLDTSFARAFTLTQGDAHQLVSAMDSAAFVARDTNNAGNAAFLIAFSSTAPVEKLLRSSRFSESGPFIGGGMKYTLLARSRYDIPPNATATEIMLSYAETNRGHGLDLVWFPKKKLLVMGDDQIVTDMGSVIDGSAESLETSDVYKGAKKTFESGSDVAFFFDTHDLDDARDPAGRKVLDGYLRNRDPFTGAIKLVKAGIMMDAHGTLSGTSLPPADLAPPASKLALPHKLPADTVAYMTMSTKTKMNGAALRSYLIKSVDESDPSAGRELRSGLEDMERALGFKLDDIVDMTGDEAAIAVVLDPSFKLDTTNGITDELSAFGLVYAVAVKDDAKAKMVLGKIRAQLEAPDVAKIAKVRPIGSDGWEVDPETSASFPVPNLTVKYDGKQIIAVLASPAITTRTLDALQSNKGTLTTNAAHELAWNALPQDANFYMWLDTGRITSVMLDGASHVRKGPRHDALPIDAIRLTGPDHVTTALAIKATPKSGTWAIDIDSLNLPATALFSVAEDLDLSSAMPRGDLFGPDQGGQATPKGTTL